MPDLYFPNLGDLRLSPEDRDPTGLEVAIATEAFINALPYNDSHFVMTCIAVMLGQQTAHYAADDNRINSIILKSAALAADVALSCREDGAEIDDVKGHA